VDTIASEYDGKVTVVKCNVDDCEDVAAGVFVYLKLRKNKKESVDEDEDI
jgi:hypothetical protein